MKCIVTGAAGFIGSHLCERLISDGHEVIGIDNLSTGRKENLESIMDAKGFIFLQKDVNELVCDGGTVDWYFHLAAKADIVPSIENPHAYHNANVTGTINALQFARDAKAKKFIYAASSSCYGDDPNIPTNEWQTCDPKYPYALTKYLGEQYVLHWNKVYKLPAVSLRLFNVYGPRARSNGTYGAVFGVFLSQLAHGKPLTVVGDGTQSRDFTYVTDVVDAFVRVAESPITGVMNVGTGEPQTINHLIDLLGPTGFVFVPKRPGEPETTCAEYECLYLATGWTPRVSFEEGVAIMKSLANDYKDAPLWTPETIAVATESWFKHL